MRIRVRLFAVARQAAGTDSIEIELPEGADVGQLRRAMAARVPGLGAIVDQLRFAVDEEFAGDDTKIPPTADVACIPPVSGG
jgi:molybdopterin converting factor subunit 1